MKVADVSKESIVTVIDKARIGSRFSRDILWLRNYRLCYYVCRQMYNI